MGTWGYESCSSDYCWDLLCHAEDIHNITQAEANVCVTKVSNKELKSECKYDRTAALGVVIWCLDHGCVVEREHLINARDVARSLLEEKDKSSWSQPKKRIVALQEEIKILNKAIDNGGKGQLRHVKGLMENLADLGIDSEK